MPSLRLLSVNARPLGRDRAALSRLLSSAAPDLACVHGAPQLLRWRSLSAAIARRAGLVVVHAGGLASGANLLLSSLGVDAMPGVEVRFPGGGTLARPGAALAALSAGGVPFVLGSAAVSGNAAVRVAQVRALQRSLDAVVPGGASALISVLGPDRPGAAAWQELVAGRVAVGGRVFVDERISVEEARDLDGPPGTAPLLVTVRL